jgi:hypothetical protein
VGTGSRQENATREKTFAFSSEVDTGSRQENATREKTFAFPSEVDTGSRQENAKDQEGSDVRPVRPDRMPL